MISSAQSKRTKNQEHHATGNYIFVRVMFLGFFDLTSDGQDTTIIIFTRVPMSRFQVNGNVTFQPNT